MKSSQSCEGDRIPDKGLETLLTESEYARITKRSVASLRRDRLLGKGCPYVKLGALVRYRPDDLRAHLNRNLREFNNGQRPTHLGTEVS